MGLKTILLGDPEKQGMKYRVRIFDHGHHIKTVTVPNRGQDNVKVVVKGKDYGFLGEEIKLAFMINPEIPPHYFGNIAEIDFDIRDSSQLADLFDLCPDLVYELNEKYAKTLQTLRQDDNVINAEFTEKKETETKETGKAYDISSAIDALTDPVSEPLPQAKPKSVVESTIYTAKTTFRGITLLNKIKKAPDDQKQELIKKCLNFCSLPENQKALKWLPKRLHIEPDIMSVVSQIELDGVGIMPMYYTKQSAAEIAEKMLARPKGTDDWKTTLIYLAFALCLVIGFGVMALKLLGKI